MGGFRGFGFRVWEGLGFFFFFWGGGGGKQLSRCSWAVLLSATSQAHLCGLIIIIIIIIIIFLCIICIFIVIITIIIVITVSGLYRGAPLVLDFE